MLRNKLFMMAAVAGLAGALAIPSAAQNDWHRHHDRDHDRDNAQSNNGYYNNGAYNNSSAYQQGMREGQRDRARGNQAVHRHAWRNNDDARAYANGYSAGYNNTQAAGRWNNGRYYGNGAYNQPYYGNQPYYNSNTGGHPYGNGSYAMNMGYQDGIRDGQNDRSSGHSFRPTSDDNYKSATRGYRSELGSQQNYKNIYRQGYQQGYQQGYNGGGRRW